MSDPFEAMMEEPDSVETYFQVEREGFAVHSTVAIDAAQIRKHSKIGIR